MEREGKERDEEKEGREEDRGREEEEGKKEASKQGRKTIGYLLGRRQVPGHCTGLVTLILGRDNITWKS